MDSDAANNEGAPQTHKKLRLFILVGVAFVIFALGIFYIVVMRGNGNLSEGVRSLFPFGEATDVVPTGEGSGGGKLDDVSIGGNGGEALPRMWKIADGPVSGSVFKTLPDGTLAVRYVLREDGDIFEYSLADRSTRLLANNTIPRVAEALWDARGQSVVLRTATDQGNIVSILGKLLPNPASGAGDEAPAILEQQSLRENIAFLSPGPTEGFVHTAKNGTELSIILLDSLAQPRSIFSSPFTEWIPEWSTQNSVGLTTRPSGSVGGYFFVVDTNSGKATPVLNDVLGLTTKGAPDGKHVLVGGSKKGALTLGIIAGESPVPNMITPATLPEKCAWSASSTFAFCGVPQNPPSALYPDEWYQGVVQFSDTLWVYTAESGQFTLTLIPQDEAGVAVDIINPSASMDGKFMLFTNKVDGSLWGAQP